VWEWNETAYDGSNNTADESRELRGGSWGSSGTTTLDSLTYYGHIPTIEDSYVGFRVAIIPEPSSLSLLALGGVVVALGGRKK
jgi:formylglycine-generating enzyme